MSRSAPAVLSCALLALMACRRERPAPQAPRAADSPVAAGPGRAAPRTEELGEARELIAALVRQGYEGRAEIIEAALDDRDPALAAPIEALTDELLADHRRAEAGWKAPTDPDRIDRAFAMLAREGIVARQNFSDCQTCGHAEIVDEMDAARAAGVRVRGYVFFHQQDTERVLDGALYLAYGAAQDAPGAEVQIARSAVRALESAGLRTRWDGTAPQRVAVVGLDWKKRRFTRSP